MNLNKIQFIISFLILNLAITSNCSLCYGQNNFASPDYYLVDSLVLEDLTEVDRLLIDSCLLIYHAARHDTTKIDAIANIADESWDDNVWPKYNLWVYEYTAQKLTELPNAKTKKHLLISLSSAISNIGYYYTYHGDIDLALEYYNKGLKIQEEIEDKQGISISLSNIGVIYVDQGNIPVALEYYRKSLKIEEELNNKQGIATSLNNIGLIHVNLGDYELALEYYNEGLSLQKEIEDQQGIASSLNNIGLAHDQLGDTLVALDYYNRSLKIQKEIEDKYGIATSLNNIGTIYKDLGNNEKALEYFIKGMAIDESLGNKYGMASSLANVSEMELEQGNIKDAKEHALRSMDLSREVGYPDAIRTSAHVLFAVYEKEDNSRKALEMHKLFVRMRDSVVNEENQKLSALQKAKYTYEKQKAIDDAENEKKKAIDDAENEKLLAISDGQKQQQQIISYSIGGGLGLVLIFSFLIFKRLQLTRKQKIEIEKQKEEIENTHDQLAEHHKEIADSIIYAKRLQQAILPSRDELNKELKDGFILFEPKDVVSGDFYWMEKVGDTVFVAAADCTGHGVPGAMVSVVCSNALDRALKEFDLTNTGEILDKVTDIVIARFEKSGTEVKDGMDIGLCAINWKTKKLQYSGANNPLWLIRQRNGNEELEEKSIFNDLHYLEEHKATKQPIGKYANRKPFEATTIDLKTGDYLYIFTDGFADQFGGPRGKKFKYKPFKKLLLKLATTSMEEQHSSILKDFNNWKGDHEQIDDVCVIGVKI